MTYRKIVCYFFLASQAIGLWYFLSKNFSTSLFTIHALSVDLLPLFGVFLLLFKYDGQDVLAYRILGVLFLFLSYLLVILSLLDYC